MQPFWIPARRVGEVQAEGGCGSVFMPQSTLLLFLIYSKYLIMTRLSRHLILVNLNAIDSLVSGFFFPVGISLI